jgi:hypothetical protein
MTGPGENWTAVAAARGHLRASDADREQMIDALKAAFVQGRLTRDGLDARTAQTLASRTYAELAMVTVGVPPELTRAQLSQRHPSNAARWGISGLFMPATLAVAAIFAALGARGYEVLALVIACVYFVFWLSAGADLLWQWHCMCAPGARMCVRCAHTATSHHARASCTVRLGSLRSRRCSCAGYVPPGLSPKAADPRLVSAS